MRHCVHVLSRDHIRFTANITPCFWIFDWRSFCDLRGAGVPPGCAILTMGSVDLAASAMEQLNGKAVHGFVRSPFLMLVLVVIISLNTFPVHSLFHKD